MCWSSSASIAATALGGAATVYGFKKGVPKVRVFTLAFFTFMELIQALSYIWIDQCSMNGNTWLTYLSYVHIAFQPPVVNAFILSFVPDVKRKKWFKWVMGISFVSTFLLLAKLFVPMVWQVPSELMCKVGDMVCGPDVCTYRGDWHLAWRLPLLGVIKGSLIYSFPVFILPILYGRWRISVFHFIFGPFMAALLTSNPNEMPAIWCLFSVALACAMYVKPLKKFLVGSDIT